MGTKIHRNEVWILPSLFTFIQDLPCASESLLPETHLKYSFRPRVIHTKTAEVACVVDEYSALQRRYMKFQKRYHRTDVVLSQYASATTLKVLNMVILLIALHLTLHFLQIASLCNIDIHYAV